MTGRRRKRSSGIEALLELPWQALLVLSVMVYAAGAWLIPALAGSSSILKPLVQAIRSLVWIPAAGLVLLALISFAIGRKSRLLSSIASDGEPVPPAPWVNSEASELDKAWDASIQRFKPAMASAHEWSLELLRELEWKRFEMVCAAYYQTQGFRVEVIRCGADGGIDAKLYRGDDSTPGAILQCKAWNTQQVGVKPVRELLGVMVHNNVANGIFLATGTFTKEAVEFARCNPIELVSGGQFVSKVKLLSPADSESLLKIATDGDYITPTCPSCGIKMVSRSGSRGRFWGCINYPRCRQRFVQRESRLA